MMIVNYMLKQSYIAALIIMMVTIITTTIIIIIIIITKKPPTHQIPSPELHQNIDTLAQTHLHILPEYFTNPPTFLHPFTNLSTHPPLQPTNHPFLNPISVQPAFYPTQYPGMEHSLPQLVIVSVLVGSLSYMDGAAEETMGFEDVSCDPVVCAGGWA